MTNWSYCPNCGMKFPDIEELNFCPNCALNLEYVKEHKQLPPQQAQPAYASPTYYSNKGPVLSDNQLLSTKGRKLWGSLASIGFPLLAFIVMNGIILGVIIAIILLSPTINLARDIVTSPFFMVISTLAELLLMLIPIWYIKKYLQNPSLENRLTLLGFTTKGYDKNQLIKEVLIGIAFAFVGILVVVAASLGIELLLRYAFGVQIIHEGAGSNVEYIITGMDILILILMILVMIFIVGPCEEMLFRGFMMKGLTRTLGDTWGLILTAFIFAIIHLVGLLIYILNPIVFLILFIYMLAPYFAISLMLGLMYRWRGENLIAVTVTHGVYNSITILIAFLFMVFY